MLGDRRIDEFFLVRVIVQANLRFHLRGSGFDTPDRLVFIRLTVAHLDRTPGHDDDANLGALCQFCHLNYDRKVNQHRARSTRVLRKDAARPLLQEAL